MNLGLQVLAGPVTECERYEAESGKVYFYAYVLSGREVVRTVSQVDDCRPEEQVILVGRFEASRFGKGVEFRRVEKVDLKGLVARLNGGAHG